MSITITKDEKVALGGVDVRDFKEGEVHTLAPEHEARLVELGIAKEGGDKKAPMPAPAGGILAEANYTPNHPQTVDPAAVSAQKAADEGAPIADGHPAQMEDASTATGQTPEKSVEAIAGNSNEVPAAPADAKAKAETEKPKAHHAPAKHATKPNAKK